MFINCFSMESKKVKLVRDGNISSGGDSCGE